jgi:hypothetical protein
LRERLRELATAVLVARHLPPIRDDTTGEGSGRHDHALAVASFVLRGGRLDEELTLKILRAAWDAKGWPNVRAKSEAHRDLGGIVRDTAHNLSAGLEVVGGRRLKELSPGLPRELGRWWEWGSPRERPKRLSRPAQGEPRDRRGARHIRKSAAASSESVRQPLPGAAPFPEDALPEECWRFVREGSEAVGCPPELLGLPVLAVLSSAIGASRVVQIKPSWKEGASLYLGIVAPPGAKKTPAAKAATEPVRKRQAELQREYREKTEVYDREMREWEVDKKLAHKDNEPAPHQPEKPVMGRVIADDTTVDALVGILEDNPRGLLVDKDELTGWVRAMDQFRSGGKGSDQQHWLSIWSSKPVVVDRKSRAGEPVVLARPWVTLFGAIQPTMLEQLGGAQEDGLLDRFLFAYPVARRTLFSEAKISSEAERKYDELYRALLKLRMVEDEWGEPNPGIVPMTPKARDRFRHIVDTMSAEVFEPGFPARLRGVWSKMEGYLARIALILGLCRVATTGEIECVEEEDVEAAARLIRYFKAHARRVYAQLGIATSEDLLAGELKGFLNKHGGEWLGSATELYAELKARESEGLPENPEWLSRMVLAIGERAESLEVVRKKSGSRRFLKLALGNTVPTVPDVETEWDGRDGRDGKFEAPGEKSTANRELEDDGHAQPADTLGEGRGTTVPGVGTAQSTDLTMDERGELCMHDFPGDKGCFLCDPEHPYRLTDSKRS